MKIALLSLAIVLVLATSAASQGLPPNQESTAPAQAQPAPQPYVMPQTVYIPGWYAVPVYPQVQMRPVAPIAQWEYYAWLNANYREVRGPLRRMFYGPYVRRSPYDPVFVSYYFRR